MARGLLAQKAVRAHQKDDEQGSEDGALITAFTPSGGGLGIIVVVQVGELPSTEPSEVSNKRCQKITAGGLTGMRCFDTVALTISTILDGKGKIYTIATIGKHLDEQLYQRFLNSFAPTA